MKTLWFIVCALIGLTSCGNRQNTPAQTSPQERQQEYVEVLYFHGKPRCVTCNAIEKLTKEVIEENFAAQLKKGEVLFQVIDITTPEGEKIADKYEVTWSSLYINQWKEGNETRNDMTDFAFSYAKRSPEVFKAEVKKQIEELLH